jgi:hypothetical protein
MDGTGAHNGKCSKSGTEKTSTTQSHSYVKYESVDLIEVEIEWWLPMTGDNREEAGMGRGWSKCNIQVLVR